MAIRVPSSCKKFRPAAVPLAVFLLIFTLPGLVCVVLFIDGLKFDPRALLIAAIFVAACSPILALLLSHFYAASVSADGVYGHSFWGLRRFASWRDIVDAKPYKLLNLLWLRIHTADKKVTWLALFHWDRSELQQEIHRFAPSDSPILLYFQ
jgi:hypothetical protein